ncbi:MAG TPA: SRPBCC family protein [Allosphingosinicella sp.]|nr:SRPBCC family protein [Allosphingosinicella sp.]
MLRLALAALLFLAPAGVAAQDVTMDERREADGTTTLSHAIVIDAPAAEVWAAVSSAAGWRTWAVPIAWDSPVEPDTIETSYSPNAQPGDPTTIRQRILARIPGRLIVFRTVKAPEGFPHFETFARTTGFMEVEPLGERRTRVRVTGTGYPDTEAGRTVLGFFRDGNRVSLESLRQRFVSGPRDWSAQPNLGARSH